MTTSDRLPAPCRLCGNAVGVRSEAGWVCAVCGWRFGDVPDDDLPLPRIDVVYYLRYDRRVKIGTSRRPRQRLASIRHHELLAFEQGDRMLEHQRHVEFADAREGGEWFTLSAPLAAHVAGLRRAGEPWNLYARWLSEALRG
ncbi:GIY-YIG nuclease family protein [Microbacterium sp. NPDC090225]|uniref:GIY-YIG nuclease family protein n=1 Tax=Microbacterium sp. NPDC090225 TaxID=3364207 RepID=UPI0038121FEC